MPKFDVTREVVETITVEAIDEERAEELASDFPIAAWWRDIKQVEVEEEERPYTADEIYRLDSGQWGALEG